MARHCPPITPGVCYLDDPTLGVLDLSGLDYCFVGLQIGFPEERAIVLNRALNDGARDDTKYVGGRAVTIALRFRTNNVPAQDLWDRLAPYLSPRYRPRLVWAMPGTPEKLRSLVLRGQDLPLVIDGPKYPAVVASFVSPDAYASSPDVVCQTIVPSTAVELGRAYDLDPDREYPFSLPIGGFEVTNDGNAPTDWTAVIFGPTSNPILQVNDITITTHANAGVVLLAGQRLVIDTQTRTILFDADPGESRYDRANYLAWEWDELRLLPGANLLRFTAEVVSEGSAATICWRHRWH